MEPVKSYYTNRDIYEFLRPDRDEMPYLYDNFEWPHCDVSAFVLPLDTSDTQPQVFYDLSTGNSVLFVEGKGKKVASSRCDVACVAWRGVTSTLCSP